MRWTVSNAAREFKCDPVTIQKGLNQMGLNVVKHAKFSSLQIVHAIFGDLEQEKVLETRQRRKLLEKQNAEKDRVLVNLDEVQQLTNETFLPIRQRLVGLSSECGPLCNPSDPKLAFEVLENWIRESLPYIRDRMPKPPIGQIPLVP